MAEESDKKRKATSELPMREEAMLSPSNKSDLHTKIDVDSDEIPRLKKGTRSVTALRHGVRKNKLIANEFPPGIVQTVRVALFQQTQEPQCGANLVRNLCAQNLIPPKSIARELLDVIKFGPKAEGGRSLQTEVASSYACALVSASSRLVRRDGSAIFGPSTWDDVEVLLSQSTDRAMSSSGLLFAHELQMAACGAKLLSLLLKTELLDFNLSSTDFDFNSESLRAKPTVAILKKQGLSNVLKTATRHTIKCLVRHAKWLLDSDIDMPPCSHPNHGQCCAAKTCLDSLGSVMCYTAWLFCAEERVSINHFSCAIIIRDVVLSELSLCDDSLPITNSKKKKIFITKLKLHFLLSLLEEFAFPMQDLVGNLIGLEDELDWFDEETTKQEGVAVHEVGNAGRSNANQLVRKSSVPVLVQRQNDLVEAYELENKNSSVFWVEYVSDGKCVPVSSDRIIRGRKRNPRPSTQNYTHAVRKKTKLSIRTIKSADKGQTLGNDSEPDGGKINSTLTTSAQIAPASPRRLKNGQSSKNYVSGQGKLKPVLKGERHDEIATACTDPTANIQVQQPPQQQLRLQHNQPQPQQQQQQQQQQQIFGSCLPAPFAASQDDMSSLHAQLPRSIQGLDMPNQHSLSTDCNQRGSNVGQGTNSTAFNPPSQQLDQNASDYFPLSRPEDDKWAESAAKLGLVDTPIGIRLDKEVYLKAKHKMENAPKAEGVTPQEPIVLPTDKKHTTAFAFHLMSQLQPCTFTKADTLGRRRGLEVGYAGLACRHCVGGNGSGRFIPSSVLMMSNASKVLDVVYKHLCKCKKCPPKVKNVLTDLRSFHDRERSKMPVGRQRAFFTMIWRRLHTNDSVAELPALPQAAAPPVASRPPPTLPFPQAMNSCPPQPLDLLVYILQISQLMNDRCRLMLHRGFDSSDLSNLRECHLILCEELDHLLHTSTNGFTHLAGSQPLSKTLLNLQLQTIQNICDLRRLINDLQGPTTFAPTFAPQEAQMQQQQQQQQQNQEQQLGTSPYSILNPLPPSHSLQQPLHQLQHAAKFEYTGALEQLTNVEYHSPSTNLEDSSQSMCLLQ